MYAPLCGAFHNKIEEQIERAAHLADLLPAGRLQYPCDVSGAWTVGELLGHLLDCMAGFCATLYAIEPRLLAHFLRLTGLPVNRSVSPGEFRAQAEIYKIHIAEGFELLEDIDLARNIPTMFAPAGVPLATVLLGNLEHLINHKRQLFEVLKAMGLNVATADLYRIGDQSAR